MAASPGKVLSIASQKSRPSVKSNKNNPLRVQNVSPMALLLGGAKGPSQKRKAKPVNKLTFVERIDVVPGKGSVGAKKDKTPLKRVGAKAVETIHKALAQKRENAAFAA